MSSVSYAGITISQVHTRQINMEPQLSDDNMEYRDTKVTVELDGIVNALLEPAFGGESATEVEVRIRHALGMPHNRFIFAIGNEALFDITMQNDARRGPFPRLHSINKISGTLTFSISWSIEFYIAECPVGTTPPLYSSFRLRQIVEMDENFYTTLTSRGRIYGRADILDRLRISVDALRGLVVPPIPAGFKRVKSTYDLFEDGLGAEWTWVDREITISGPSFFGVTAAKGKYIETTPYPGAIRWAEVHLDFRGHKKSDKALMLEAAMLISRAIFKKAGLYSGNPDEAVVQGGVIESDLFENNIRTSFKMMLAPNKDRVGDLCMDLDRFNMDLPGCEANKVFPLDPGTRGTAMVELLAHSLQDPCLQQSVLEAKRPGNSFNAVLSSIPSAKITMTKAKKDSLNTLYADPDKSKKGVYKDATMEATYETNGNVYQLPISSPSNAAPDSVFIQTAAPTRKLICDWVTEKSGSHPSLPAPPLNENRVMMGNEVVPSEMGLTGDGLAINFRNKGRFVIGLTNEEPGGAEYPRPAWMDKQAGKFSRITNSDVELNLFDPSKSTVIIQPKQGF